MENLVGAAATQTEKRRHGLSACVVRIWFRFLAWWLGTTEECLLRGHRTRTITSDRLFYQKGGARPLVEVFDGTCTTCLEPGCRFEQTHATKTGEITAQELERLMAE